MFEPFAEFCESMSIPVLIVPTGFDLSPPQLNASDEEEGEEDDDETSLSTLLEDEKDDSTIMSVITDDESDSWG